MGLCSARGAALPPLLRPAEAAGSITAVLPLVTADYPRFVTLLRTLAARFDVAHVRRLLVVVPPADAEAARPFVADAVGTLVPGLPWTLLTDHDVVPELAYQGARGGFGARGFGYVVQVP